MPKYRTKQREKLLAFFSEHPDQLFSAGALYACLGDAQISLSAVYRNLSDLEKAGAVRRSSKDGTREVFYQYIAAEGCRDCLHLYCVKCGKTVHANAGITEHFVRQIAEKDGFDLLKSKTILYGLCEGCRKG